MEQCEWQGLQPKGCMTCRDRDPQLLAPPAWVPSWSGAAPQLPLEEFLGIHEAVKYIKGFISDSKH